MHNNSPSLIPPSLMQGDTIAILAPASIVDRAYVDGACRRIEELGFDTVVYPSALGTEKRGTYAVPLERSVSEFRDAWSRPDVKAIICARGGYGCIHLLPHLGKEFITSTPKWLVGFSDVSALHAMLSSYGIPSLHAPMVKHIATRGVDDPCVKDMFGVMQGERELRYELPTHRFSHHGSAAGRLLGGNLAVLNSLAATPYDILDRSLDGEDVILFVEDVSEAIYEVERMMMRLSLSGVLRRLKGLIIGQFTDYHADRNFLSVEEMLRYRLGQWDVDPTLPIAFGFPVGHVDDNRPMIESATATLEISAAGTVLTQSL